MNSNSTEKTNQNLAKKPTNIAAFRKSYPIDFCLHDDDGNSVLYIDDASGGHNHSLYLEILNTSERHIELIRDKGWFRNYEASEEHHHFELRFRPGILAQPDAITLKDGEDWNIGNKQQPDGTISLYLLHKNEQTTINVKDKLVLTLQKVNASASGGARRTQVELKYKHLRYQGDKENFSGNRLQNLSIINHYGKRNIPLHVGFVNGDDILNDGSSSNELHLRVANTTLKEVSLKSIDSNVPPKFIISFDTGDSDTNPWALGTNSQVAGIKVEVKYPTLNTNEWETVSLSSDESSSPQWETNIPLSLQQIKPGSFFEIKFSDIRTSHPSGHTNLYLRYENIPGYWDGQFVCSIEKTPLLYRDHRLIVNSDLEFLNENKHDIGNSKGIGSIKGKSKSLKLPYEISLNAEESHPERDKTISLIDFGFSIPVGAIIRGIVVIFKMHVQKPSYMVTHAFLSKLSKNGREKENLFESWKGLTEKIYQDDREEITITCGSPTDLWKENWMATDINKTGFGVNLRMMPRVKSGIYCVRLEDLEVTVYYTGSGRPRNGYFAGKLFAESIEVETIKIGDINITEKELKWLRDNAKQNNGDRS